jgi:chaperonin GroEL
MNASALVIGIDKYELAEIKVLSGCVVDAFKATNWLLALGIPPERIFLHVSKSETSPKDDPPVLLRPAGLDDITRSIQTLSKGQGDKFFVFMSGHGLYVRADGPIFLTKDYAAVSTKKNLKIEEYLEYFRSWPYRDQFVFYDACQNPTATLGQISAVQAQGPDFKKGLYEPSKWTAMTVCYSASSGQRAWAGNGHGILVDHALRELDPEKLKQLKPTDRRQNSVLYDWSSGARQLDLKLIFDDVIGQAVQQEASAAGHSQQPFCERHGRALIEGKSPIFDLAPEVATGVNLLVKPSGAATEVKEIRLVVQTPMRSLFVPDQGKPLVFPFPCFAPTGGQLEVSCDAKEGSGWTVVNSPQREVLSGRDVEIELELEQRPPVPGPASPSLGGLDELNIRIVPPGGGAPESHINLRYGKVAADGGMRNLRMPEGVTFRRNKVGPDIRFDANVDGAREAASEVATDWLKAIRDQVTDRGFDVFLSRLGEAPLVLRPNLRFVFAQGQARRLAGFLTDRQVLSLTPVGRAASALKRSLGDIEKHPDERVIPGPQRIEIDLPWGRWAETVFAVSDGEPTPVELPDQIGLEPLRNGWSFPGRSDAGKIFRIVSPDDATTFTILRDKDKTIGALATAGVDLIASRADGGFRIEPFSRTSLPEWDLIFTAGRIDSLDSVALSNLVSSADAAEMSQSEKGLLLLAVGHAAQTRNDWQTLKKVVGRLKGVISDSSDAQLLRLALAREAGRQPSIRSAQKIVRSFAIPLFRWGATLYERLAEIYRIEPVSWIRKLDAASTLAVFDPEFVEEIGAAQSMSKLHVRSVDIADLAVPTPIEAESPAVQFPAVARLITMTPGEFPLRDFAGQSLVFGALPNAPWIGLLVPSIGSKIVRGADIVANALAAALGPKSLGRSVVTPLGRPTEHGILVSTDAVPVDKFEAIGAQRLRDIAAKTVADSGRGANTAAVLAQTILHEGMRAISSGHQPEDLIRGINLAVAAAIANLKAHAKPVVTRVQIEQVATLAGDGDGMLGKLVAEAFGLAGNEGLVTVEPSAGPGDRVARLEGMEFDRGFLSPHFVTNGARMLAEFVDAQILIIGRKLSTLAPLLPRLEAAASSGRPLLIIAEDVEGEALATLVVNAVRGAFKVAAVRAPAFAERRKAIMEDLAIVTGGMVLSELADGQEDVAKKPFGHARKVLVSKDTTAIIGGRGEQRAIADRVALIKSQIEDTTSDYDREMLFDRLAKLSQGVVVIEVGGASEEARRGRIEAAKQALSSVREAVKGGVVAGGGVALLRSRSSLDISEKNSGVGAGMLAVFAALEAPLRRIAENVGVSGPNVVREVEQNQTYGFGFDATTGRFVDVLSEGILEPLVVILAALTNAASSADLFRTEGLTTVDKAAAKPSQETGGSTSGSGA